MARGRLLSTPLVFVPIKPKFPPLSFSPSLSAQSLSISQSNSHSSHVYPSSPQEASSHESTVSFTTSSTSSNITSPLSPPSLMETSTSIDSIDAQSISPFTSDRDGANLSDPDNSILNLALTADVDPQILEALKSKDRIYVLKLGETFEALIKERRARVELSPATSYQRLLVHRCSAYYKLAPENDPMTKGILVLYTADSRIPERRISELVPAESTTQPAFKIMRRSATERRSKPQSQTGSIAGDDADLSDLEPSESGSQGGRSNATGGSSKKRMTIEEREAAYNKARSRIFNKFEEQGKDKDMSASSSSLSGSTSNGTSTDEPTSSPATAESEWSATSGPRDKKDNRHGNSGNGTAPHSRSIRSGASFNGSGSSRNSRAPSPSFTYATLYEPPSGPMYDPPQHPGHPSAGYYPSPSMYSFPTPGQGPTPPPFNPMYPYYPPYNAYQSPLPHPQYNPSDPSAPSASEPFPSHQMNYGNYYGWSHHPNQPPIQSPPHTMHHPPPSHQYPNHLNGPPPPHSSPSYQTYMPQSQPHPYPYPVNGQFAPSSGPYVSAPPHINMQQQQQQQPYEVPRPMNGNTIGHQLDYHINHGGGGGGGGANGLRNGLGNGVISPNSNGRPPVRSVGPGVVSNGNGVNGGKSRPPMPPQARTAWSYGPGVGMGGFVAPNGMAAGDTIGPRLSSNHRRPSGNSNSSNSHTSSNCDEVSSTASSSTASSSSRRTYTSTTSSQHPLPARPDWAVGLKAQPTLAGRVHEQQHSLSNSRTISPISPPWSNGNSPTHNNNLTPQVSHQQQQQTPPTPFQSTDFPPLTSIAPAQEKRTPVVTGAWGVSRPSLSPTNGNMNMNGSLNGSANGGTAHNSPISRLEEPDRGGTERPVGKESCIIPNLRDDLLLTPTAMVAVTVKVINERRVKTRLER
ncbi:hypothetical protein BYT27DRAFT_6811343 [Phlegmacium glaucopus]|nr:hypothetical protein BYT27DRAFT_6811343 [Phlegmacium glaucopus]